MTDIIKIQTQIQTQIRFIFTQAIEKIIFLIKKPIRYERTALTS